MLRNHIPFVAILLSMSCSGSCGAPGNTGFAGLTGCQPNGYQFPAGDPSRPDALVQNQVMRVRITQPFLDFVRPNLPTIIRSQLPAILPGALLDQNDVLHLPLADQDVFDIGLAGVQLRQAEAQIWLGDIDTQLGLTFESPNRVHFSLNHLRLGVKAKIKEDLLGIHASCPIEGSIDTGEDAPHAAELSLDAFIDPSVRGDSTFDIKTSVNGVALNRLALAVDGRETYCAEPECTHCDVHLGNTCLEPGGACAQCVVFCGAVTRAAVLVSDALADVLRPFLDSLLQPIIKNALGSTVQGLDGKTAIWQQSIDLSQVSPIQSISPVKPIGFFASPQSGKFPVSDKSGTGMEITVNAGMESALADCAVAPPIFAPTTGPIPELQGKDASGQAYHVGVTMAASLINQFLYTAQRSGALCLQITTDEVRNLTGGQFTLNSSILSLLSADVDKLASQRAPILIELRPAQTGSISLGSGKMTGVDENGKASYDWLIQSSFPKMSFAFHVLMQDRYVRLFEVVADIHAAFNVTILPDNRLELAIGSMNLTHFEQTFNELLPNADFSTLLPTLLELATQTLLKMPLSLDLNVSNAVSSALHGVPVSMRINDLFRDGRDRDYLTLALTFSNDNKAPTSALKIEPRIEPQMRATGHAQVMIGDEPGLEYQARVDGGLWRAFTVPNQAGAIWIEDPRLFVPGSHQIEIRARQRGDYRTLQAQPTRLSAILTQ